MAPPRLHARRPLRLPFEPEISGARLRAPRAAPRPGRREAGSDRASASAAGGAVRRAACFALRWCAATAAWVLPASFVLPAARAARRWRPSGPGAGRGAARRIGAPGSGARRETAWRRCGPRARDSDVTSESTGASREGRCAECTERVHADPPPRKAAARHGAGPCLGSPRGRRISSWQALSSAEPGSPPPRHADARLNGAARYRAREAAPFVGALGALAKRGACRTRGGRARARCGSSGCGGRGTGSRALPGEVPPRTDRLGGGNAT
jgi:hypothetical protein